MIGNDLVDLAAAGRQSNWRRKGFLDKVFSKDEQAIVSTARDQNSMVWLLWSMKEAAYKAHQRRFSLPRKLQWQRQKCSISTLESHSASGMVLIEEQPYFTSSNLDSKFIHTLAVTNKKMLPENGVFEGSSEVAKIQLLNKIGEVFSLHRNQLSINKNPQGVPSITYNGELFFTQFSLSGHGKYTAYSMSLIIS